MLPNHQEGKEGEEDEGRVNTSYKCRSKGAKGRDQQEAGRSVGTPTLLNFIKHISRACNASVFCWLATRASPWNERRLGREVLGTRVSRLGRVAWDERPSRPPYLSE